MIEKSLFSDNSIIKYDNFDEEILKAYGFKTDILPQLYSLLTETIRNRVEMKNR